MEVCKFCQREVRANKLLGHYTTHAVEWSLGAKWDIKQYCNTNKKPLMYEFGLKPNTIPWVVCLACHKFKTINARKFITEHKCDCVWDRYKHLYEMKDLVIAATTDTNTTELILENAQLKDNVRKLETENKQLRIVLARIHSTESQQPKPATEIKMEPEPQAGPEPEPEKDDWEWNKPQVTRENSLTVGNSESLRRIIGSIEHIIEEWLPYKDARCEYEELVDELEPLNLGKPYDLLRDYIRDDCSREDLEAFLTNYVRYA